MINRKLAIFYPFIIFIFTLFLSIGYASVNSVILDFYGAAVAKPEECISIVDILYVGDVNAVKDKSEIINIYKSMFNSHIELSDTDINSSITYRVTLHNNTSDVYVFNDTVYDEGWYDNPLITFDLNGIKYGDKLLGKQSISFDITFHYTGDEVVNNVLNSYLNFDFKRVYSISYDDIVDEGYPVEVIEGETLEVQFKSTVKDVIVYKNDALFKEYTYVNPVLTIPDVDGNIRIVKENYEDVEFVIDEGSNIIEAEGISPSNPVSVTDIVNQVFDGKNLTDKIINQLDVTYTYTSKTGSVQSINCILEINGKTYTQNVIFDGKGNNQNKTVSFTNLQINPKDSFIIRTELSNITNGNISITGNSVTVHFTEVE